MSVDQPVGSSVSSSGARTLVGLVMATGDAGAMVSSRPKPLHRVCGRTLAGHALDTLQDAGVNQAVVVVSSGLDRVAKVLQQDAPLDMSLSFVTQAQPLGTADAAAVAVTALDDDFDVRPPRSKFSAGEIDRSDIDYDTTDLVIIPSDRPLVRASTLQALIDVHCASTNTATLLTVRQVDPDGHGCVVRGRGSRVEAIIDPEVARMHFDWDPAADHECDTGVMIIHLALLAPALRRIGRDVNGPASLSEVIAVLVEAGYSVGCFELTEALEGMGVDDRHHLAVVEAELRRRTNAELMASGVTMVDPLRTYIDATVQVAPDVTLFPGVMLQGNTRIGSGSEIGPDCRLIDTVVGEGAIVEQSVARSSAIGIGAVVGPFAVLEPGSRVADGVRTGPFFRAD
jgi:bifunctional UDP-N-acetylglucosamine pyrophosphorylase / glucosamine-1-phosphate N-acetyltransferase